MFKKLFGGMMDSNEKEIKRIQPLVEEINALEEEFQALSDEALRAKTREFKEKVHEEYRLLSDDIDTLRNQLAVTVGPSERNKIKDRIITLENSCFEEVLPAAFAAVREAARRTLGLRHYDVQMMGGVILHEGRIAEMKTGEGKTLVATLPLYLNSLLGRGAHLVTQNDYLARRDAYWMGPVYDALGVTVASIYPMQTPDEPQPSRIYDPSYNSGGDNDPWQHYRPVSRQEAYAADITYGTSAEFGFDYLRDNMVLDLRNAVQRTDGPFFAIVDEVDNLLIDEARTPLIISAPDVEAGRLYESFAKVVTRLRSGEDYEPKAKERQAELTEEGWIKFENLVRREGLLKADSVYDPQNAFLIRHLRNALAAKEFYHRDRQYVVDRDPDGGRGIVIVDEFTGRKMVGRRYSEGLHQAIEAKEGVKIRQETKTYASITIQNYFRMYDKLCGMTGTALTEAEEFSRIYNLEVVAVPTNRPVIRRDQPDQIYKDLSSKFKAVVREVEETRAAGRPVLLGTVSIENSDLLSDMLKRKGIPHEVLNAKKHEREASVVAEAGKPGAVTVATNMAGRGVDIILGGRLEGYEPLADLKEHLGVELAKLPVDRSRLEQLGSGLRPLEAEITRLQGQVNTKRLEFIQEVKTAPDTVGQSGLPAEIEALEARLAGVAEKYLSLYAEGVEKIVSQLPEKPQKLECDIDTGLCKKVIDRDRQRFRTWLENYVKVVKAGGLHVIGTERHEARRIDNQLRGRAGRQGDPGSSRFFVSLEDDIMRRFGGDMVRGLMERFGFDENTPIENKMISNSIENSQKRVEGYNFDIRKNLVEYDDVVNKHREVIYGERHKILAGADLKANILDMVYEELDAIVDSRLSGLDHHDWDLDGLMTDLGGIMPQPEGFTAENLARMSSEEIVGFLKKSAEDLYDRKEREITPEVMRQIERHLMLRVMDSLWIEHLTFVEHLRLEAGWQTLRQVKAVDAYKNEGFKAFEDLLDGIRHDVVHTIFKVQVVKQGAGGSMPANAQAGQAPLTVTTTAAGNVSSPMQAVATAKNVAPTARDAEGHKVGRNDSCPCGSGKKYKKCCGA
ncbi:preprotein translocase, SecA subunit [Dehalogenimonas lykanthroporepellens BL-DC-9]|jgi:preprotein translocase subunit SecA|nr:preprotein translocase, SecA subunit [Dehalogenimonas lykanthroporepellens BL-DC-9]